MSQKFREKTPRGPSQRQLQVGEEIRHALSSILMRGEANDPVLDNASITVSEVKISPDLKNATAYVMPLGGLNTGPIVEALNDQAGQLRHLASRQIRLKYMPRLTFSADQSFDTANRIAELLHDPHVAQDLK